MTLLIQFPFVTWSLYDLTYALPINSIRFTLHLSIYWAILVRCLAYVFLFFIKF